METFGFAALAVHLPTTRRASRTQRRLRLTIEEGLSHRLAQRLAYLQYDLFDLRQRRPRMRLGLIQQFINRRFRFRQEFGFQFRTRAFHSRSFLAFRVVALSHTCPRIEMHPMAEWGLTRSRSQC